MAHAVKHKTEGKQYQVKNWKQYNESLVRRGDVTLWLAGELQSLFSRTVSFPLA